MGGIENMKEINFYEAYKQRKENHIAKSSFVGFVVIIYMILLTLLTLVNKSMEVYSFLGFLVGISIYLFYSLYDSYKINKIVSYIEDKECCCFIVEKISINGQNIIFQIGDIKYIIDSPYIIHYPLENKNKPAVHIKVGKNCYGDKTVCRVDIYL